jgi:hypothetical protein
LPAAYLRIAGIAPDAARRAIYGREQWQAEAGEGKSIRRATTATPTIYYVPRVVVATPDAVAVQRRDAVGGGGGAVSALAMKAGRNWKRGHQALC